MENNDKMVLSEQTVGKEYQIPELVDLNGIDEAKAFYCGPGSSNVTSCDGGSVHI